MIKVIMGLKGSGKTKQLIDLVNTDVKNEAGNVICLEKGKKLKFDISSEARLIDTSEYGLSGYEFLKGFISGLYAGNYDICHIFIDSLYKIVKNEDHTSCEEFLKWCSKFDNDNKVNFTITISAEVSTATDEIKKYF